MWWLIVLLILLSALDIIVKSTAVVGPTGTTTRAKINDNYSGTA